MLKAGFTYHVAITETDKMIRKEGIGYALSWLEMMATEMEGCDVGKDDALHSSQKGEAIPSTYGFHKVDSMYVGEMEIPWVMKQPNLIQRLITTPERCRDLYQLKNLGKGCYEAAKVPDPERYQKAYTSMSNTQRSVFWDAYNHRKRDLMRNIKLSDTAKALIKRIYGSRKRDLPGIKANLVRLQKGQIKVRDPPGEQEWEVILWHYGKRESAFL